MRRVAVVGGGFTGACFAAHLLRAATQPLLLDVVEPREQLGAGLAYGSAAPEHRINVPSDRMDVYSDDPLHFIRWLQTTGEWQADPNALTSRGHYYARRDVFGRYMAFVLNEALAQAPAGTRLRHHRSQAVGVASTVDAIRLTLASSWTNGHQDSEAATSEAGYDTLSCDAIGVFTSHAPPAFPWPIRDSAGSALSDAGLDGPSRAGARGSWLVGNASDLNAVRSIPSTARVLICGTGLTMADVVVSLRTQGHTGPITAVSRRALLPRLQSERFDLLPLINGDGYPATARGLLRRVRHRVTQAEAQGLEWQAALDGLRRALPAVWAGMPVSEQRRALRWLRPFWDVHRFRMAPQVGHLLDAGRREGWLHIGAGRIVAIERTEEGLVVSTSHRGEIRIFRSDVFINCTGPDARFDRTTNPLLRAFLDEQLMVSDAHQLGPAVNSTGCAIRADGVADPRIRVAGPLIKGTVAEVVGVPEASATARVAAEDLARWLERDPNPVALNQTPMHTDLP